MWAIAMITVRRFQEPAFFVLLVIGMIVAYATSGIGTMDVGFVTQVDGAGGEDGGVIVGTIVVGLLGALVGVFTGATEIPRDVSSRMIALLLSKPISRAEYFVGKYFGCLAMALGATAVWLLTMFVVRLLHGHEMTTGQALLQVRALLMIVPIVGIAITVSAYLADIAAMIVTCGLVFVCFAVALVPLIVGLAPPEIGKVLLLFYFYLPNLGFFLAGPMNMAAEAALVVYAISVTWLFLAIGRNGLRNGDVF